MKFAAFLQFMFTLLFAAPSFAKYSYEGYLTDTSTNTSIVSANVVLKLRVRSPGTENCLLYEETQAISTLATGGHFSVVIGNGTATVSPYGTTKIFENKGTFSTLTCVSGTSYTPSTSDLRNLEILVSTDSGSTFTNMGTTALTKVPMAAFADSALAIAGFSAANMTELTNLVNGASTTYLKSGSSTSLPTSSGTPSGVTAGSMWFDSTSNQMKYYDGTATQTMSGGGGGGTVTSVTAGAPLSVSNASTTPVISMSAANGSTSGYLTSTDWMTFNGKLTSVSGSPLNSGQIWIGNGSNTATQQNISGDITISNTGTATLNAIVPTNKGGTGTASMTANALLMANGTGSSVISQTCSMNEFLKWNGTSWVCASSLSLLSGTATSPSLGFSGSTGTGIYLPTGYVLGFSTSGIERMRIDNSGNVGIGTTTPSNPLTVVGSGSVAAFNATATGSGPTNNAVYAVGSGTAAAIYGQSPGSAAGVYGTSSGTGAGGYFENTGSGPALVTNTGNVGIGTTAPAQKLDVFGNVHVAGQVMTGVQVMTAAGPTIDFNNGNTVATDYNCSSNINLANIAEGGNYTVVVTSSTTTQCTFNGAVSGINSGTVTYRFSPANSARTASYHTVYHMTRVNNIVYVKWETGY